MSGVQQNMGVHTCAVGMTLTAAQYYEIKKTVWEIFCVRAMETTGAGRSITPWTLFSRTGRVAIPLADGYDLSCEGAGLSRAGYS